MWVHQLIRPGRRQRSTDTKPLLNSARVSARGAAFQKGLYALQLQVCPTADPEEIEQSLSLAEQEAAKVLKRIIETKGGNLTIEQKEAWARLIFLQLARHPQTLDEATTKASIIHDEMEGRWRHRPASLMLTVEAVRNEIKRYILESNGEVSQLARDLAQWNWGTRSRGVGGLEAPFRADDTMQWRPPRSTRRALDAAG